MDSNKLICISLLLTGIALSLVIGGPLSVVTYIGGVGLGYLIAEASNER